MHLGISNNSLVAYGFAHITSSPMYPQSNGSSECMVQTMKDILKKCDEEGSDPYLGLLCYRFTPVSHHLKSPSELLNHCKFKATLPMAQQACVSNTISMTKRELYRRQELLYLHSWFKPKAINIYDHHSKTWECGTIIKPAKEPRSYIVKNDRTGSVYRRTRAKLRPSYIQKERIEPLTPFSPTCTQKQETKLLVAVSPPDIVASQDKPYVSPQPYVTRSGWISKPLERLNIQ